MVGPYKDVWDVLSVQYSDFIRTTDERHKKVVYEAIKKLLASGDIYVGKYEGWYCVPCESFWSKAQLNEGTCPDCQREVQRIEEENLFFKLAKYQEWLLNYIEENPDFILPKGKKQEVLGFLREPLEDLCISRAKKRMSWVYRFLSMMIMLCMCGLTRLLTTLVLLDMVLIWRCFRNGGLQMFT